MKLAPRIRSLILLGALLGAALASACGSEDRPAATYVRETRAAHAAADRALERGDREGALAALRFLLEERAPEGLAPEDAWVIRADAAYRLAELELGAGDPEAALAWIERGLEGGARADLFEANLLVTRGRALEALGRDVEAARAYHEALVINDELLGQTLEGPEPSEEER